jgi:hypothetical protein
MKITSKCVEVWKKRHGFIWTTCKFFKKFNLIKCKSKVKSQKNLKILGLLVLYTKYSIESVCIWLGYWDNFIFLKSKSKINLIFCLLKSTLLVFYKSPHLRK